MSSRDPLDDNLTEPPFARRERVEAMGTEDRPAHPHWVLRGRSGDTGLAEGEHLIGRGRHCQICILDAQLSREHARLRVLPHAVVITDCGSLNGVVVNGQKIHQAYELRVGDRVSVGQHEWHLEQRDSGPKTEPPPAPERSERGNPAATVTPPIAPSQLDIARASSRDDVPAARVVDDWSTDVGSGKWRCPPTTKPSASESSNPSSETGGRPASSSAEVPKTAALESQVVARTNIIRESASSRPELPGFAAAAELARKALTLGNPSEAVRQLTPQLAHLQQRTQAGVPVDEAQCADAARLVVLLTHATLEDRWLLQIFKIHTGAKRPLPSDVVDELFSLPREIRLDLDTLRTHLAWAESGSASAEHDLSRLQAFVRLMATR